MKNATNNNNNNNFNVDYFFNASTIAIDFLLTFTKAVAASGCSH
jgi:hypothetical protein